MMMRRVLSKGGIRRLSIVSKDILTVQEYEKINERLLELDRLYYDAAVSRVSDREYDELAMKAQRFEKEHPHLISSNSRSLRVGTGSSTSIGTTIKKIKHIEPVLSLTNSYDTAGAAKLLSRGNEECQLVAEPKIDGVSITIRYDKNGMFLHAATRGDGRVGEDVTRAVSRLGNENVPLSLPNYSLSEEIEVRGEMYVVVFELCLLNYVISLNV